MQKLLPGVRHMGFVKCCFTADEKALYDQLNQDAVPLVERACSFFKQNLPDDPSALSEPPSLSVAPVLKKLCKRYGYSYVKHEYGCFFVQKRTDNGHYILLDFDVGPVFKGVGLLIRYVGAGFDHQLGSAFHYPQDPKELEHFLIQIFETLSSAEKEVFPALDAHYPITPHWFTPIL